MWFLLPGGKYDENNPKTQITIVFLELKVDQCLHLVAN